MLAALLVLSGASALVYEVLWARDWALVYGATATGTAVVLAATFAGLALGALLGQTRAGGARPGRTFALLEAGVVASVLAYLALRPALPSLADGLRASAPAALRPLATLMLPFATLAPTALLLGATLPVIAAAGDPVQLYAWNTLGGAAGALATTVLVPRLGLRATYLLAAVTDAAVAGTAWRLDARPHARDAARPGAARAATATLVAGLSGALALAAEVLWVRGLAGVLSSSPFSVAIVLAVVLTGLVLGAQTVWLLERRGVAPAAVITRGALGLAALLAAAPFALRAMPAASLALITRLGVGPRTGFTIEALLAALAVGPGAIALGTIFPSTLALAAGADGAVPLGRLLAANTAGGIAGALGASFVLLPRLGIGGGLLALAAGATALAALVARGPLRLAAAAVGAGACVAAATSPPLFLPSRGAAQERLLFYSDGPSATVTVTADAAGQKRLRVNAQYALGGTMGLILEAREAHLPLLLHPEPRRLLHLGVGTGDTLGAAMLYPGIEGVGVELLADVLDAARLFSTENHGLFARPGVRLLTGDARTVLRTEDERYDVILADLYHPWTAGAGALFSLDHYRLARARLAPGGLFCHWLPLHQIPVEDLRRVVATFLAAFPHVQLWLGYHRANTPLAALIGSETPIAPDADVIRERLRDPGVHVSAAPAGLDDPLDLAVLYVASEAQLAPPVADVAPMTDDRPVIEFDAAAAYFEHEALPRAALQWLAARLAPGDGVIRGAPASFPLRAELAQAQLALLDGNGRAELGAYLEALRLAPGASAVRQPLSAIAGRLRAAGDSDTADRIVRALAGSR